MFHAIEAISIVLCIFLSMLSPVFVHAQETLPAQVYIGLYMNQIYDISLRDNKFSADFYIWFRWKGDNINPLESFEVVNGRTESIDAVYEEVIEGYNYASCRVVAIITKFWDVTDFPLDDHVLTIEIEDTDNESFKLHYIADRENS